MSLHPIFEVKVGTLLMETGDSRIIDIAVRASMDSAPGSFETTAKLAEKAGTFSMEDKEVVVSLGYMRNGKKELTPVFTGKVESISNTGPKVMVMSPLTKLYNLQKDQLYEGLYAGDIVKDLAKDAQIQVDTVSNGIKFPSYVINRQKSDFEHIKELAKMCGFDFHTTNAGKLVFKEYLTEGSLAVEYGKHIIEISLVVQTPPADSVKVAGSSPAGTKGEDKHSWLKKKDVEAVAGSGSNQILVQNMALKDSTTTKAVADATLKELKEATIVNVKIVGNEKIMLGGTVNIQNVPQSSINGDFEVREIEHIFSKTEGFTTNLTCRKRA